MSVIIPIRVDIDVAESVQQFDLSVLENEFPIEVDVATPVVASTAADYDGSYVIIPKVESQTMPTENKRMRQDVLVREIPYYEVSNVSGLTVYIANTLDG